MSAATDATTRTAQCGCGALSLTVSGEPEHVYICSCTNCQRESGSAFTYCAIYSESAVDFAGDPKLWRRSTTESGRWIESGFCQACGVTVFFRMEAWSAYRWDVSPIQGLRSQNSTTGPRASTPG